ncbi:hypothetical protein [Flavobacterium ammonificans]|uniref:Uncharacterized protein n=1 Tax=Flavobacterium ammonificans TaxID=1751056 RepID=A0ABM7UXV8_9FLAO|nr:hypothetical protein [Flavobacterium ammonificans]BDB52304.1 hypothetical protein GENT11_06160 [Flavobacterium ammonificans]
MKTNFNKILYLGFVLLGGIYLYRKDIGQTLIYFGIALAFDPFNIEQKWNDRPFWQKIVLISHLSIVFGMVFIEFFNLIRG